MFHKDNARSHVSAWTNWNLYKPQWDPLRHPSKSPGLVPSDNYLQMHLKGAIFNSLEDAKIKVELFLDSRSPEYFMECIEKLTKCCQKIVKLNRDNYPP